MGTSLRIALFAAGVLIGLPSCDGSAPVRHVATAASANDPDRPRRDSVGKKMKVTIGSKTFTATLEDNPTTAKLRAMLPLTLDMSELNGNEKHAELPEALPANASRPGTIRNGDLMLYGTDTLVALYVTFQSSYSYTRLGRVDDSSDLPQELGPGQPRQPLIAKDCVGRLAMRGPGVVCGLATNITRSSGARQLKSSAAVRSAASWLAAPMDRSWRTRPRDVL